MRLRRLAAILLLAVFCLPVLLFSVAMGQDPEAGLPACCRRAGVHRCAMTMGERAVMLPDAAAGERWTAPEMQCPYCPGAVVAAHGDSLVLPVLAVAPSQPVVGLVARVWDAMCRRRIALDGARQKRGPPHVSA